MTSSPFHAQKVTTPWNICDVLRNRFRGKETQPLVIRDTSHPALLTWFLSRAPRWQRSPPLPECAHGSSSEPGRGRIHFFLRHREEEEKSSCLACKTTVSSLRVHLRYHIIGVTHQFVTKQTLQNFMENYVTFKICKNGWPFSYWETLRKGVTFLLCLSQHLDTFSLARTRRLNELCFVQITVTKDTVLISTSNLLIQGRFSFYKAFLSVKTLLPTPTG